MCILEYLDVIHLWFPYSLCNLLEKYITSTFVSKSHVCTIWLKFWNEIYSISWEFINQPSTMDINICMQKIPNVLLNIILYIPPPIVGYYRSTSQVSLYCENIISSDYIKVTDKIRCCSGSSSNFILIIFGLYNVVSNFAVNFAHNLIGSCFFFWHLLFSLRLLIF